MYVNITYRVKILLSKKVFVLRMLSGPDTWSYGDTWRYV